MNEPYKKLSDLIAIILSKRWLNSHSKDSSFTVTPNYEVSPPSPTASPSAIKKRRENT